MNASTALKVATEPAEPELPGLPIEFQRRPAPAEFQKLGEPLHEVAPGVWACGTPEWEMPTHVLCKLVPGQEPGTWTLEPETQPGWVRMCDNIGDRLGVKGLSANTMRRLIYAGFVEHFRPTPACIFIHLESLLEHFRHTRNDCAKPSSFWTPARRQDWQQTICAGSNLDD